jgi:tRNA (guanine37-N1)-methyltransferase|tara:strand:+ start:590 stop:1321 length:732 start_codon:yes stop_codon:yes gene_type:complete
MNFNILTIFPEIFDIFNVGLISKSIKKKLIKINTFDIRENSVNKHNHVDSKPYGGGEGMVMMAEPLAKTLSSIKKRQLGKVIYLSPQGKQLDQKKVVSLASRKNITLICGRYEGIDQRVIEKYVDEEISIGDFVLSGGEYAAICLIDAISRHIPGVLGNKDSYLKDTFSDGLLKGNVYTKPEIFEDMQVPEVLLSGNHKEIQKWRLENSLLQTFLKRPDLIAKKKLSKKYKKLLEELASKAIL